LQLARKKAGVSFETPAESMHGFGTDEADDAVSALADASAEWAPLWQGRPFC